MLSLPIHDEHWRTIIFCECECVCMSECMCELVICYRNHTYHVCLIFISLPGHKMTSLQTCTANMNPHVRNEAYNLYSEKSKWFSINNQVSMKYDDKCAKCYQVRKAELISCFKLTKTTISWLKLLINLKSNKWYVTWKTIVLDRTICVTERWRY